MFDSPSQALLNQTNWEWMYYKMIMMFQNDLFFLLSDQRYLGFVGGLSNVADGL